ncbi:MAG: hypothetical protein Q9188_007271, partial [Gyalolechia gomerana]
LKDVVSGFLGLVNQIPRDEMAVKGLEGKREEVLGATGQIWKTCDRMNKVAQMGIVGVAVEKVDGYHALVKDAVEELEAWDPDEEEEEGSLFGSSSGSGASNNEVGKKINGDVIGRAHQEQSESEPPALEGLQIKDMHAVKEGALKILKLIRMLYPALRKRRVSTFPPFDKTSALDAQASEDRTAVLDQLLRYLQGFSDETDEVAGALYGGDVKEVGRRLESLKKMAEGCVGEVRKGWKGQEDEFSAWSEKWVDRLKEAGL